MQETNTVQVQYPCFNFPLPNNTVSLLGRCCVCAATTSSSFPSTATLGDSSGAWLPRHTLAASFTGGASLCLGLCATDSGIRFISHSGVCQAALCCSQWCFRWGYLCNFVSCTHSFQHLENRQWSHIHLQQIYNYLEHFLVHNNTSCLCELEQLQLFCIEDLLLLDCIFLYISTDCSQEGLLCIQAR